MRSHPHNPIRALLKPLIMVGILFLALVAFERFLLPEPGPVFAQDQAMAQEEDHPETALPPSESAEEPQEPVTLPQRVSGVGPETFRMIEMLERKNRELKEREKELQLKENRLKTLEEAIRKDIEKINGALARSQEQIGIKKDLIEKNVLALVKVYSSMKPEEAAKLLEALDEDLALQIISKMKSKVAGKVLSRLDVKIAKNISEKMAGKKDLPGKSRKKTR